ncbi:MAG: hypothetical protein JWR89_2679 [Tardiphaga sp.]|jgi:hypothetical protein|uniref:hypothetical protein n=1 Tax=Tardiphaga sp. TaxID=1926292 RepID=UPI0026106ABB|nr:hypothetical protein [Tardiphaga sp.]MDB5502777.1 hypothetical protein [Tardiphaga sp.]
MMPSIDELEQAYRLTYRRLIIGMIVAYAVTLGAATVFVVVPAAKSWERDAAPVLHRTATLQSAGAGGQPK